ncbi:hypothetical protein GC175_04090 [bacterium]|nr:hypothetical protein [bacterium]
MGKTNFDDLELGDRSIEAREIGSESATDGQVLTADGTGGAAWEDVAGAVRMVGTALVGGDFTGNARGANAVDLQTGHADPSFVASGPQAIAIGQGAKAAGYGAIAIGGNRDGEDYWTKGEGDYAIALGTYAKASGSQSIAIGYNARNNGLGSVAIGGNLSKAYGLNAVAVGTEAEATQQYAVAIGGRARATAEQAVAIGPEVNNSLPSSLKIGWSDYNGYAHFTTFTPTVGTPAASHFLPVNLGGTVYKFLLAT